MRNKVYLTRLLLVFAAASAAAAQSSEAVRWKQQAARVTIIRDDWGIAHVH